MKKFKKLFSVILCVILTVCLFVGVMPAASAATDDVFDEVESNDSIYTADVIYNGYSVYAELPRYDMDYFEFTLSKRSEVEIDIVSNRSYLMFGIIDGNNNVMAISKYDTYIDGYYFFTCDGLLEAGTYYICAFNDTDYIISGTTSYLFEYNAYTGTWENDGAGWWFKYMDGTYPKSQWLNVDDYWYFFDASGYVLTGWQWLGNAWYYFNPGGDMASNTWVDGYYLSSSGAMTTPSWQSDVRGWWYSYGDGSYAIGWAEIGGSWYYFNTSGYMQTGWVSIGGTWYYFLSGGQMVTGWQWIGNSWYYFNAGGNMATGWQWIDNTWYFFNSSGVMA